MDRAGVLVGDPNLAAVGPEEGWHHSWSFNRVVCRIGRKQGRDLRDSYGAPVNPKDDALLARNNHVKPKCPKMVERNPVVVRCGAARPEVREHRGDA